jgi:hypothetical protein
MYKYFLFIMKYTAAVQNIFGLMITDENLERRYISNVLVQDFWVGTSVAVRE